MEANSKPASQSIGVGLSPGGIAEVSVAKAKAERSGQSHDAADAEPFHWIVQPHRLEISAQIQSITRNQPVAVFFSPRCAHVWSRCPLISSGQGLTRRTKGRRTKAERQTSRKRAESETQRRGWQKEKAGCVLMGGTMKNQTSPDFFFHLNSGGQLG
ncbi:hypothetical protein V8C40DRAFT_250236 [Trichoderma camerunense]